MGDSDRKIVTLDDIESRHLTSHRELYFDWIRHLVTLSTAALTALLTLQGHYVPRNPVLPWCLEAAWIALLATLVLGLFALKEEQAGPLRAAIRIRKIRKEHGDAIAAKQVASGRGQAPPRSHHWAVLAIQILIPAGLALLCIFAIGNLGR